MRAANTYPTPDTQEERAVSAALAWNLGTVEAQLYPVAMGIFRRRGRALTSGELDAAMCYPGMPGPLTDRQVRAFCSG